MKPLTLASYTVTVLLLNKKNCHFCLVAITKKSYISSMDFQSYLAGQKHSQKYHQLK